MNADAYRGSLIRVLGTNPGSLEEQQMLLASLQPQKIMSMCSMCIYVHVMYRYPWKPEDSLQLDL